MEKVYLLIDVENVSIKNRKEAMKAFGQRLANDGYTVYRIGLAAKDSNLLNEWKEICINLFKMDKESIKTERAAAGYDSADMALCFIAGYWSKENELERFPFIILSNDKILKKVEIYIKRLEIECLSYSLVLDSFKRPTKEPVPIIFDEDVYPYGYTKCEISIPHLDVITHPCDTDHPIVYLPIPNIGEEITLGINKVNSQNPDTIKHVCLDYWDQMKKHSLYPIHSYIGYKNNGMMYIRSAKGFRRGARSVEVNGRIINSAEGNVSIKDGDNLKVGGFVFNVVIPKCYSNRKIIKDDNVDTTVKNIEIILHQWIRNTLEISNKNWWEELVREDIRQGCDERNDSDIEHSYNFTFLKDLDKIIKDNWTLFSNKVAPYYMSKGKFSRSLSQFILIRNKVMHPTRTNLGADELEFISDFNYTIDAIVNEGR